MIHLQMPVTDWPQALDRLPPGTTIKSVDRGDLLVETRAHLPSAFTVLRHWNDNYAWTTDWETAKVLAREWFDSFIDGTFKDHYAPFVSAVSERNEYSSHVLPYGELIMRILWAQAASTVWATEYRTQSELEHIRLILMDNAVGNDLPREVAVTAIDNGDLLGYHPYIAVYAPGGRSSGSEFEMRQYARTNFRELDMPYIIPDGYLKAGAYGIESERRSGEPSPNEWEWASGRWHFMEQAWGLKPDWILTEAGPVRDASGTGWLQPNDGWRHNDVCNADIDKLLVLMDYWLDNIKTTPAYQEGRLYGYHLFTTGGGDTWDLFEFKQPELNDLADWHKNNWKPGVIIPPDPPDPNTDLVMNPSFEEGWTDVTYGSGNHTRINQQPNYWILNCLNVGEPLFDWINHKTGLVPTITAIPECKHVLSNQLPPNEQCGQPDALILGDCNESLITYKGFSNDTIVGFELVQSSGNYDPNARYKIVVPIRVHYHDVLNEPDDVEVHFFINGDEEILWADGLPDRTWVFQELIGWSDDDGYIHLAVQFGNKWANSRDFWIDDIRAELVEDPVDETFDEHIWNVSLEAQTISLNADAALQKEIYRINYVPVGSEAGTNYDGKPYILQPAENLTGGPRLVAVAEIPYYDNVWFIEDPEAS